MSDGLGIFAGQLVSSAAQLYANKQNIDFQKDVNDTSIQLANTSHQREVADLRAAGLNPILSASGSGSPVPGLTAPHAESIGKEVANSAREIARYESEQYKLDNESTSLQNDYQHIVNSAAEQERAASAIQAQVDQERAELERSALREELGYKTYFKDGKQIVEFDERQFEKAKSLVREGIRSDFKNRANSNLRNWIPLMGNSAQSTLNAAHKLKWLVK